MNAVPNGVPEVTWPTFGKVAVRQRHLLLAAPTERLESLVVIRNWVWRDVEKWPRPDSSGLWCIGPVLSN